MYPPQMKTLNLAADRWVVVVEVEVEAHACIPGFIRLDSVFGESLIMRATRLPLQSMAVLSRFFFFFFFFQKRAGRSAHYNE